MNRWITLFSNAPYLPRHLEAFEIPYVVLDDRLDHIRRDRRVCHLRGIGEPRNRKVERPERKVAADDVRGWVRNVHPAEAPVDDSKVVARIAPATQSASGIRVLPER